MSEMSFCFRAWLRGRVFRHVDVFSNVATLFGTSPCFVIQLDLFEDVLTCWVRVCHTDFTLTQSTSLQDTIHHVAL